LGRKLCKGICLFFWKLIYSKLKKENNENNENNEIMKLAGEFEKNMA